MSIAEIRERVATYPDRPGVTPAVDDLRYVLSLLDEAAAALRGMVSAHDCSVRGFPESGCKAHRAARAVLTKLEGGNDGR